VWGVGQDQLLPSARLDLSGSDETELAFGSGACTKIKHLALGDFLKLRFRRAFVTGPSRGVNDDRTLSVASATQMRACSAQAKRSVPRPLL